jgi:hypothetical protein
VSIYAKVERGEVAGDWETHSGKDHVATHRLPEQAMIVYNKEKNAIVFGLS